MNRIKLHATIAMAVIMLAATLNATAEEMLWDKTRQDLGMEELIGAIFTPGDTTLLLTDGYRKVIEVDVETGEVLRELPHIQGASLFSSDGQYLYTNAYEKVKWPSGEVVGIFPEGDPEFTKVHGELHHTVYNEKKGIMIGLKNQGEPAGGRSWNFWKKDIWVYDMNTLELIDTLGFYKYFSDGIEMPNGSQYFRIDGKFMTDPERPKFDIWYSHFWDIETLDTVPAEHPIRSLINENVETRFSPDSKWICAVKSPNDIAIYDNVTYEKVVDLEFENESTRWISSLAISPDSKYVAGASNWWNQDIGNIHIWDIKTGKLLYKYNNVEDGTDIRSLTYSSDGNFLLNYGKNEIGVFRSIISSVPVGQVDSEKTLYPNPTTGEISIDGSYLEPGHLLLELMNLSGLRIKLLHEGYYAGGTMSLDISSVPAGTYFLRATQGDRSYSFKIMKER